MNRRRFFLSLFGATLLPFAVHGRARQGEPRLAIQESALAGFQYYQGERLWPRLHPGQVLTLVREPENRHDRRAVRLDWYGRKLGYLPRGENAAVSQMLGRGVPLSARIIGLRDSRDPWARVRVAVELSIADPEHPSNDELLEWAYPGLDPEAFDMDAVDRKLEGIK